MFIQFPTSQQIRGLVDCDSFFASCEIYFNPALQGLPVCIGKDVVIARSYEAKPYGIKVGTPVREAKKMLPSNAVFLSPRFDRYNTLSNSLMSYLREKCIQVEVFSIDEAFFEITGYAQRYNMDYLRIARALKHDIKKKIGIPVSVGIGPTRILAKIFADMHKPFGECLGLEEKDIDILLKSLPLAAIPFIGPQSQQKLQYKCTNAYDFKALPSSYVQKVLGKNGLSIWFELNGINATSYKKKEKPKSITRTRSFNPHFTHQKEEVRSRLIDNVHKAVHALIKHNLKVGYIKIVFRTKEFQRFGYDIRLPIAINDNIEIMKVVSELFEQCVFGGYMYRTTGIIFGSLTDAYDPQGSLFEYPQEKQETENKTPHIYTKKSLSKSIYSLNKKYGTGTIHIGASKKKKTIKKEMFVMEV